MEEWKRFINWWNNAGGNTAAIVGIIIAVVVVAALAFGAYLYFGPGLRAGHQPGYITKAENDGGNVLDITNIAWSEEEGVQMHLMSLRGNLTGQEVAIAGDAADIAIAKTKGVTVEVGDHKIHVYFYRENIDGRVVVASINHCNWDGTMKGSRCVSHQYYLPRAQEENLRWRNPDPK